MRVGWNCRLVAVTVDERIRRRIPTDAGGEKRRQENIEESVRMCVCVWGGGGGGGYECG